MERKSTFNDLFTAFKQDAFLNYFDLSKNTFIFIDAYMSGISTILAQGDNTTSCRPVAFVTRVTNTAEKNYSQLDLETTAVNYS